MRGHNKNWLTQAVPDIPMGTHESGISVQLPNRCKNTFSTATNSALRERRALRSTAEPMNVSVSSSAIMSIKPWWCRLW